MENKKLDQKEQFLKDLELLVSIDSGKDNPKGIKFCMDFFATEFSHMGWMVRFLDIGYSVPLFFACNRNEDSYDFLLTGHLDTVFPIGTAKDRPFKLEGSNVYGPGSCDMKAGCLAILYALRNLDAEVLQKKSFMVIFQPDEEIGSPYSRDLMIKFASYCKACFVFEATDDKPIPVRCIQRKGIMQFKLAFHGRAGHAANLFFNGSVSAIEEMAYWINEIANFKNEEENITTNIGVISGGTASNVVAEYSEMFGEIRFEDNKSVQKAKKLLAYLFEHAKSRGITVDKLLDRFEPPMQPSTETIEYVDRINTKTHNCFPTNKRGGLSAANFLSPYVKIVIDGFGPPGAYAHSELEYTNLEALNKQIDFVVELLSE